MVTVGRGTADMQSAGMRRPCARRTGIDAARAAPHFDPLRRLDQHHGASHRGMVVQVGPGIDVRSGPVTGHHPNFIGFHCRPLKMFADNARCRGLFRANRVDDQNLVARRMLKSQRLTNVKIVHPWPGTCGKPFDPSAVFKINGRTAPLWTVRRCSLRTDGGRNGKTDCRPAPHRRPGDA